MNKIFSNFNLSMLNLWLGLCRGEAGLPQAIRNLGYRHKQVELTFQNSSGKSVKPELIIATSHLSHTILFEWKTGPNTDSDQLERYARVQKDDLIHQANLQPAECSSHDTCIVGLDENADRLAIGIKKGGYLFPLIVVESDGLLLKMNRFAVQSLTDVFSPKLDIDFNIIPMSIIPFDHNSQSWEIAQTVIPQIVHYMASADSMFTIDNLGADCTPLWKVYLSSDYRRTLSLKIQRVVEEAADHEFNAYLRRDRGAEGRSHSPTWQIVYNPRKQTFDKRSGDYRKLRSLAEEFIEALRTGKRNPDQLTLDLPM
jgi:hypothetical protein